MITGTGWAVPFPVKLTICGLPAAVSVIVMDPGLVPVAVGVKVTLMAQFAVGATEGIQLLVWAKSPLAEILVTFSVTVPTFVSVITRGVLGVPSD